MLNIYFVDFYYYLIALQNKIMDLAKLYNKAVTEGSMGSELRAYDNIGEVEDMLYLWALHLDKCITLRVLNCYRFEDISEVNILFNSSIQQLISMYNAIANYYAQQLYGIEKPAAFLVLINYKSTVANVNVINYNVYDFFNPEFIFYTLPKEILNKWEEYEPKVTIEGESKDLAADLKRITKKIHGFISDKKSPYYKYIDILIGSGVFDSRYLINDSLRFGITCNYDPDMFVYWTWAATLKNSSAYDFTGTLWEYEFLGTLFRIMFTLRRHGIQDFGRYLRCPIPELENLWFLHFGKLKQEVMEMFRSESPFCKKEEIKKKDGTKQMEPSIIETMNSLIRTFLRDIYSRIPYHPPGGNDDDLADLSINIPPEMQRRHQFLLKICKLATKCAEDGALLKEINWDAVTKDVEFNTGGNEVLYKKIETAIYIYLHYIKSVNYAETPKYINYLHRNRPNGKPIKTLNDFDIVVDGIQDPGEQKKDDKRPFYRIDQTGNVFFTNGDFARRYFKIRNSALIVFWDLAQECKRKMIDIQAKKLKTNTQP